MTAVSELLAPGRDRYGVDWSVKVCRAGVSSRRFVLYGVERARAEAFLDARGARAARDRLGALMERTGPPFRVMVGADGDRTKLYADFDGHDPAMLCIDSWTDRAPVVRWYRRFGPRDLGAAVAASSPRLASEIRWLAGRPAFGDGRLFHIALQRSREDGPYTGADLGFAPDWEGLATGSPRLLRRDLIRATLARHGLQGHFDEVDRALLTPPIARVHYVGFRVLPGGEVAVNVYATISTVVASGGRLVHRDMVDADVRDRPLVLRFALDDFPEVGFRLRPHSDAAAYRRVGPWQLDYSPPPPGSGVDLTASGVLDLAVGAAEAAATAGDPLHPAGALGALRRHPGVVGARLLPDVTGDRRITGIDTHYTSA